MSKTIRKSAIALAIMAFTAGSALAGAVQVNLSGSQEVPPVQSAAAGSGTIMINDDKTVSGSVTTTGVKGTMAHIHEAPAGKNGGVAIPLEKKGQGIGLFVLNGTRRQITGDIVFPSDVMVSDLAVNLSNNGAYTELPQMKVSRKAAESEMGPDNVPAARFALEVPPCGILPLAIDGLGFVEEQGIVAAALLSKQTRENAVESGLAELPGLDLNRTIEELWN